ncbi:GntR family transcriptional regulator [Streptomyces sp. MAR4 CNX-425]|uniref:GntR family transcriptional regulator n=1 Tax=Streptomyces sp. MAR4 CNX-425 TaxID=3406343 RepID=UPI003B5003EA
MAGRQDRAEYVRIARELRARIMAGDHAPGSRLPTLPELAATHGVSETTIRQALAMLRGEGLIETRARAGTRVRARPPVHRLQADRYRNKRGSGPATPYTRDQGIGWSEYRLDKRFELTEADDELAELFGGAVGEQLLARHFVFHDNDVPTQMSTSYLRWSDVADTPVADPINEPWPGGTRAQLASIGVHVAKVTESLTGGMPSPGEAETLRLGASVPVLRIVRRHIATGGRVVEVARPIVRRADTTVVEYEVDLDDGV